VQINSRSYLKLTGATLLIAFGALVYLNRKPSLLTSQNASARGEEVYASHDCTDCHLAAHVLKAKRARAEPGLIRARKEWNQLLGFLQSDQRHASYVLMAESDRQDLIAYLKSLQ
jgi:cytochrome c2